jgi:hypothetical protein
MRIACWMTKDKHTHTQNMKYLLLFHGNSGYANALQWYVTRTLPLLFLIVFISVLYVWPFTSFVVAAFSRTVNDLLSLTPARTGAVPILVRLAAFNLTKKADCISITSAEPRQRTVRKPVSVWRWLPSFSARGNWPSRRSYCGSRGERVPDEQLYLTRCHHYSIGSPTKDIRCMVVRAAFDIPQSSG